MQRSSIAVAAGLIAGGVIVAGPGPAQAETILYQGEDSGVGLYGWLRMGLVNEGGDNSFEDFRSRLGFTFDHAVRDDLSVFANAEYRFDPSEQNDEDSMAIHNTYFGVDFHGIGQVYAGNFDSVYYQQVSMLMDIAQNTGFRALNMGNQRAWGNSVAFDSESFNGFRFGGSLVIQEEGTDQDEATSAMAYVGYSAGDFNAALAYDEADGAFDTFDDDSDDAGLVGLRADYDVTDTLNVGAMGEIQGDDSHYGATFGWDYGAGLVYGLVSQVDIDAGEDDDMHYMIGANYQFSEPMNVFVEYAGTDDRDVGFIEDDVVTVGARYNF